MNFKCMFIISRPILWFATSSAFLLGTYKLSNFSLLAIIEFLFFLFPLNFYLYGLNDIYDLKSDNINPRKGGVLGAKLNKLDIDFLKKTIYIPPIVFLAIASFSLNLEHIIFALIFVTVSFIYSHPLFRFKERLFLDTITSTTVYASPLLIAFSLHDSIKIISPHYFLLVLPFMGLHALSTLPDAYYDNKANIKTTGIILGRFGTLVFMIITLIIPFFFFLDNAYLTILLILGLIMNFILLFAKEKDFNILVLPFVITLTIIALMSMWYFFLLANFY